MKKLIKQQQDRVLAELCQKIVAKKWSEKLVAETPDEVKAVIDVDKIESEPLKELYKLYKQDLKDVETNTLHIEADIFAYRVLENIEKELKDLCIK